MPVGAHPRWRAGSVEMFEMTNSEYAVCRPLSTEKSEEVLGWLVLVLVGKPLPQPERTVGWDLAERWMGEVIEGKRSLCGRGGRHDGG